MNLARCKSIFQKEGKHILRDPFTLILALLLPFLIVIIFGNAFEFNLKDISMVVVDHDKSQESRQLIETFSSSGYFKTYFTESPEDAIAEIHNEKAKIALIIPPDFDKRVSSGQADVQIIVDGADNTSLNAVRGYITRIGVLASLKLYPFSASRASKTYARYTCNVEASSAKVNASGATTGSNVMLVFNPELDSKWFTIPGLSAVIIALVSILLTSLTICKEREQGSMELLLSTPVKSVEIIVGKILPYALLGWIGFGIVYAAARFLYEIPFFGHHWILLLGTAIFILDYLAIGLFISITATQQQMAVQMALIIGLLPTMLLSGFVFPIEYMPRPLQYITMIFPARWYIEITRCEFLKASEFADLVVPFAALIILGIVIITAAIKKFKDTLE
ncbi:membrane protein [Alphaproteobacteria bacterium]|nr:membrane protein [Alphaproteobacteria bacterium]